jgi:hypothetical protein
MGEHAAVATGTAAAAGLLLGLDGDHLHSLL